MDKATMQAERARLTAERDEADREAAYYGHTTARQRKARRALCDLAMRDPAMFDALEEEAQRAG